MKPTIVFFSRAYQTKLFPLLTSPKYNSIHVTLLESERFSINKKGVECEYSFEGFNKLVDLPVDPFYLETSFLSDRFLNKYNFDERLLLLRKEIAFWSEIFDKYNPTVVVNELVAIEISEVMYIEAKKRKVKYLAWMSNPINGYFYWLSNPMTLVLSEKIFNKNPSEESLKQAEKYVEDIRIKNIRPYYLEPYINQHKLKRILGSFKALIRVIISESFQSIKHKNLKYEKYIALAYKQFLRNINVLFFKYARINEVKKHEVIFYTLHYEPEASLSYLSEFYSNQIATIENIAKCLGTNQVLVVKEHPAQSGMLLLKNYRDLRKKVSNLYYLPHNIISYDVIKISKLIITCTSHLGWEALILGKPVFIMGKMFYFSYPYINKFETYDKLREKIRGNNFIIPKEEETIRFIAQLLDYSYRGKPFPCSNLYEQENIKDLVSSLEMEVEKITANFEDYTF